MKKRILVVGVLVAVILAGVIGANAVFAQDPSIPPVNDGWYAAGHCSDGGGMMGSGMMGSGMMGSGMMGGGITDPVTLNRVAGVLGLTYEQLTTELTQGQTLAQIAQAQGVNIDLVVTSILAPQSEMLQVRVKYGYLTSEQAQAITDQARLWIQQVIATPLSGYGYYNTQATQINPASGYAPGYRGGGMMGGGMMGGWGGTRGLR